MWQPMSFFSELKRRNVIRVGIAYVVVAWLILQFSDVVLNNIEAPGWVFQVIMLVLAIGLPLVLVFAWAFEMTPDGLKKEKDVDRSQSIAPQTGKKLNNTILILLALAVAYLLYDKFSGRAQPGSGQFPPAGLERTTDLDGSVSVNPNDTAKDAGNKPQSARVRQSIAVLPFQNRSRDEDDAFFADGIHDDLLTQLAKIKDLKVISRTSMMKYKDTQMTIPEIAAELNVSSILEGGIQRAGDRIRINAQLIEVNADEHLWAETFDREMTVENIFDIQSEITRHIVTAIRGELSEEESGALSQRPTTELEAYEAYLKARAHLNDPLYRPEKYINAEKWLQKAVESDPGFALAWGQLVATHGQAIWQGYDESPERFAAALNALENAEKFGPNLPETIAARAEYLYRVKVDFHAAEPLFAQASQAKPGDVDLLNRLAVTERRTGQFEQAITHLQMAIELDPANLDVRMILLDTLVLMGAYDRAEPLVDLWMEKFPETGIFKTFKAQALALGKGQVRQAKVLLSEVDPTTSVQYWQAVNDVFFINRDFQGLIDRWSRPPLAQILDRPALKTYLLALLGRAHGHLGNEERADQYIRAAIDAGTSYHSQNKGSMKFNLDALALAYAHLRQFEKALEVTDRAYELLPESADSLVGPQSSAIRARILGMAGQRDAALAEIERLLNTPAGLNRWDLYLNPDWDFFRDDERFNALARPDNLEAAGQ
jgi:TolB-like protein/Tfp pilus assembly protein PilF